MYAYSWHPLSPDPKNCENLSWLSNIQFFQPNAIPFSTTGIIYYFRIQPTIPS